MDKTLNALDWTLVQAFLAVAEAGSLSGAARVLGMSQPTLGRHVRAIEAQLGLALFTRHARGLELTQAGAELMEPAREMRDAIHRIARYAAGKEAALAGTVRITASEMVSHHLLPPIIAGMRTDLPDVQLELAPSDTTENLLYREADIALRMYEPRQIDLVSRKLGEVGFGAYAARSYVARRGLPRGPDELAAHDLVGYDRSELILRGMHALGLEMRREDFSVRCDDQTNYWELVRAGCGIGFGQSAVALEDPEMVPVPLGVEIPGLPVWIAAHRDLRHTPRVRAVWDALIAGLVPRLEGNAPVS